VRGGLGRLAGVREVPERPAGGGVSEKIRGVLFGSAGSPEGSAARPAWAAIAAKTTSVALIAHPGS
jgi:hypothetical protein